MLPPPSTDSLVTRSASELATGFRAGTWSAAEIVAAHIERIEQVDGTLNAVVVRCFERARRTAAAADEARRRGDPLGPLAGVPLTIKECYYVADTPATMGVERLARIRQHADGPLVRRLVEAGGIVLGKTNVPQLMTLHECENPVYGRTIHPRDARRSPGGSSGGEGAIIAAFGSPLGLASDLGGSIRQPAHVCGIAGLKPTTSRVAHVGSISAFDGLETLGSQPGPLARRVEDLVLMMRVLVGEPPSTLDPRLACPPWPDWRQVELAGLRVGYFTDDGFFRASPAIRRGVDEGVARLRAAGVECEPFEPPQVTEAMRLYFRLISAHGGGQSRQLLAGGQVIDDLRRLLRLGRIRRRWRPPLCWLLDRLGQPETAWLFRHTGPSTAAEYWRLTSEVRRYIAQVYDQLNAARLDALVMPPHGLVALTHHSFVQVTQSASYSMWPNLLGLPAGVVPVTEVRRGEESDRRGSRDWVQRAALAVEADSAGLPVGVQVVARHWREDVVLRLMGAIERGQPAC